MNHLSTFIMLSSSSLLLLRTLVCRRRCLSRRLKVKTSSFMSELCARLGKSAGPFLFTDGDTYNKLDGRGGSLTCMTAH